MRPANITRIRLYRTAGEGAVRDLPFILDRSIMMRSLIYRLHTWLGLVVAVPVLLWAASGLFYAWPGAVEGGKVEIIDAGRVRVSAPDALARAREFAGRNCDDCLTLLMATAAPSTKPSAGWALTPSD